MGVGPFFNKIDTYFRDENEDETTEPTIKVQIQRAELASSGQRRRSTLTGVGLSRDLLRNLAKLADYLS
jgi:hypothetical protein